MIIIKDEFYGDKLRLLKNRLTETIGHASGYPYYVLLADIRDAVEQKYDEIQVHGKDGAGYPNSPAVTFLPAKRKIGCRTFSPATFAKILKAAGVVRKTDKPAKKGK